MSFQSFSVVLATLLLLVIVIITIRYLKIVRLAQKEYEKAKNIISGIVLTFNRRLEVQNKTVDQLTFQLEDIRSILHEAEIP